MNNKQFCIVDIETTGLSAYKHKITEIAAVIFDWEKIVNEFCSFVNPECHIPSYIVNFCWITNEMVKNAPTINEILPSFLNFMQDNIFVAHNATFDKWFIWHNANQINLDLSNPILCTRKLANRITPHLQSKSLAYLSQHFCIVNDQAHRALSDVITTSKILWNFLTILKNNWINSNEEILKLQNIPARNLNIIL